MNSVISGLKVLWRTISWSNIGEDLTNMSRTVTPKQMPKMAASKGKPATKKGSGKPKDKSKCKSGNGSGTSSSTTSSSSVGNVTSGLDIPLNPEVREEPALTFPLTKTADTSRTLPRYYVVLTRTEEEGVMMDDLDQLQMDLESLLSKVAVRQRLLHSEILALNNSESNMDRGKASSPGKKGRSRGSKLVENLTKTREVARSSSSKHSKKLYRLAPLAGSVPVVPPDNDPKPPAPKVFVSKNSAPNRFWASVDPYCSEVNQEHVKVLEDLIHHNESSLQSLLETPGLGEHYSVNWALQELAEAQEAASMNKQRRKHTPLPNSQEASSLLKRSARFGFEKQTTTAGPGPFANRLLAALIQENPVSPLHESSECNKVKVKVENDDDETSSAKRIKLEPGEKTLKDRVRTGGTTKAVGGENIVPYKPHVIACFERSLRLQLEAQGLLDAPEVKKEEEEDGVLSELHRCQEELQVLSQENERQLRAMIKLLQDEMVSQDLRRKLKHQDNEILENYRKIVAAKQKRKPLSKLERDAAWKAVRDREIIVKNLDALERKW
ncbi:transcriptional adapter 3 [Frankliniella occidentalis]|uniref:Transcriptional adapter 3 n=1 Tax=Frankliniella occidentalis TaxID=133901 RepID=A0A6J1T7U9_FRAOC|nr:transcriptional adapter 3 [Frankliniella occidentalis]